MKQADLDAAESLGGEDQSQCSEYPVSAGDNANRFARAGNAASLSPFEAAAPVEAWSQIADCEARNALQVILSGSEILLQDLFGRLLPDQRMMIDKILGSAQRLSIIIATLTKRDDPVVVSLSGSFAFRSPAPANKTTGGKRAVVENAG
jgi:hypothetical protein